MSNTLAVSGILHGWVHGLVLLVVVLLVVPNVAANWDAILSIIAKKDFLTLLSAAFLAAVVGFEPTLPPLCFGSGERWAFEISAPS